MVALIGIAQRPAPGARLMCSARSPFYHAGGGRGPVGKVLVMERCAQLRSSPNWAPAFAGVVEGAHYGAVAVLVIRNGVASSFTS